MEELAGLVLLVQPPLAVLDAQDLVNESCDCVITDSPQGELPNLLDQLDED